MAKVELIDFYAEWCGPCKVMTPTIESLMEQYNVEGSNVEVKKSNVDQESELASKYSVRSIPTLVFLKDGVEADRVVGIQSKEALSTKIAELMTEA